MYQIKLDAEVAWGLLFAAGTYLAQLATDFNPDQIDDWETYAISAGVGLLRIVGAYALNVLRRSS